MNKHSYTYETCLAELEYSLVKCCVHNTKKLHLSFFVRYNAYRSELCRNIISQMASIAKWLKQKKKIALDTKKSSNDNHVRNFRKFLEVQLNNGN